MILLPNYLTSTIASHHLGRSQEKIGMTLLKMHLQFDLLQGRHCKRSKGEASYVTLSQPNSLILLLLKF